MNIAFHHMGGPEWPAGEIILQMLSTGLQALNDRSINLQLAVWENKNPDDYRHLLPYFDSIIKLPSGERTASQINQVLNASGVDVYFSLPTPTVQLIDKPVLLWIYDLLFKIQPEQLNAKEITKRNRLFAECIEKSAAVLTYSHAVELDLQLHFPSSKDKYMYVYFEPLLESAFFAQNPRNICDQLELPERFFFLPNQFRPYKNHMDVVHALSILSAKRILPVVVCTGHPDGDFFNYIISEVNQAALEKQFIVKGLLKREQMMALMRCSLALINPSSFEGFSLSVAEAAALQKPMLLSDLAVFREHKPTLAQYFPVNNAETLAELMQQTWQSLPNGPSGNEDLILQQHTLKQKRFGEKILDIIKMIAS